MSYDRARRWIELLGVGAILLLSSTTALADPLDVTWTIAARRMGVVDRLGASGYQPRVWASTWGDYLVTKRPDDNIDSWGLVGANVDSGVDALAFSTPAEHVQRVFYAAGDRVLEIVWDDDAFHSWHYLPETLDFKDFSNTDVASAHWIEGSVHRYAVASIATDGSLCVWEGVSTSTVGLTSTPDCSSAGWAETTGADIVGAAIATTPLFAYRCDNRRLCRTRRGSLNNWFDWELGLPTGVSQMRSSVFIATSPVNTSQYEIGLVGTNNRLYTARVTPTSTLVSAWSAAPSPSFTFSSRVTTIAADRSALCFFGACGNTLDVFAGSSTGELEHTRLNSSGSWSSWSAPRKPTGQSWLGTGATMSTGNTTSGFVATAFGTGGESSFFAASGVLMEVSGGTGLFRDHIQLPHHSLEMLGHAGATTHPATESVAIPSLSIASMSTAIRRDAPPPWKVSMSHSFNGGFGYTDDFEVNPTLGSGFSLTDPWLDIDASNTFHHTSLEVEVVGTATSCAPTANDRRVVHREGTSASSIASMPPSSSNLHIITTAPGLDHPGLAITNEATGAWANIAWWNTNANVVEYATVSPSGAVSPISIVPLPDNPAGVLADAAEHAYVYSFVASGSSPTLCRVRPSGSCGQINVGSGPFATAPDIRFGPTTTAGLGCGGGNGQSCFDTNQPFGLATDPNVAGRVHAVYQANVGGRVRVYYLRNSGSLTSWTTPIPIDPSPSQDTDYIDCSVMAAEDGTLFATYLGIRNPGSVNPETTRWVSYSTSGGATWSPKVQIGTGDWNPADLPFHCSRRKFFLGEYREGGAIGGRALVGLPMSRSGNITLDAYWFSRWSISDI